jgi:hypothetical protein
VSPFSTRRAPRLRAGVADVPIAPAVVTLRLRARLRVLPVHLEATAAIAGRVASHLGLLRVAARHGAQCESDQQIGKWVSTTQTSAHDQRNHNESTMSNESTSHHESLTSLTHIGFKSNCSGDGKGAAITTCATDTQSQHDCNGSKSNDTRTNTCRDDQSEALFGTRPKHWCNQLRNHELVSFAAIKACSRSSA